MGACTGFSELTGRGHDVMKKIYGDAAWRAWANAEGRELSEQTNFLQRDYDGWFSRTSVDETELHTALIGRPISELAAERGQTPFDTLIELAVEEDLKTRFRVRPRATLEELTQLVKDHRTVLGAHDAGAHVDMLCDSNYTSYTLRYWVREQKALTLEEAVWRMSGQPAELWGITDRGIIAEGRAADLVAFDPATVSELPNERVYDFPAAGERLISRSIGIEHIWVNGVAIRRDGHDLPATHPGVLVTP